MSELTPLAKAFLETHAREGNPSGTDRSRVRAAVAAAMVAPAVAEAASAAGAAKTSTSAALFSGVIGKSALVGTVLLAAVTAALVWQGRERSRQQLPVLSARVANAQSEPAELQQPSLPAAPVSPQLVQPAAVAPPLKARLHPHSAVKPTVKTAETDPLLAREVQLVAMAQRALRERNSELALQLLDFRDQEVGAHGRLEEEAMAATVWALCGVKRLDEAQAAHATLKSRFPASLHLERTKNACW